MSLNPFNRREGPLFALYLFLVVVPLFVVADELGINWLANTCVGLSFLAFITLPFDIEWKDTA